MRLINPKQILEIYEVLQLLQRSTGKHISLEIQLEKSENKPELTPKYINSKD